jgi:hypothetical protein
VLIYQHHESTQTDVLEFCRLDVGDDSKPAIYVYGVGGGTNGKCTSMFS